MMHPMITLEEKALLARLWLDARAVDGSGVAWAGYAISQLAHELGCSEFLVKRLAQHLKEAGAISSINLPSDAFDGEQRNTLFALPL
jgi:hypothetical protein